MTEERLDEAAKAVSMDRRDFLRLTGSLGVALPAGAALLSHRAGVSRAGAGATEEEAPTGVMGVADPYTAPPVGSLNSFVSNHAFPALYWDLMEQPLAGYEWDAQKYIPRLATSWKLTPPNTFVVQLRKGVKWSDGSKFSSQDVVSTFTILRAQSSPVWDYLGAVAANGPDEVVFTMSNSTTLIEYLVLRTNIRAHSVYGSLAGKAQTLFNAGDDVSSPQFAAFLKDLDNFRPKKMVVSGPYQVDPSTITGAQQTLNWVPTAWNASQPKIKQLINYNGAAADQVTPLILAKKVMFATHGFSAANIDAFHQAGIPTLKINTYQWLGFMPNLARATAFQDVRVRQALQYGFDRKRFIALNTPTTGDFKWINGLSDPQSPIWLDKATLAKLNPYKQNTTMAGSLMEQAGYKKVNGIWTGANGPLQYQLLWPSSYGAQPAQQLVTLLANFGIKATLTMVDATTYTNDVMNGNFDLTPIYSSGTGKPHPFYAYDEFFYQYNASAAGGGSHFPLQQTTKSLGKVDLGKLTIQSAEGLNLTPQKATIAKLALAWNELVPRIAVLQRIGVQPLVHGAEVEGWPPLNNSLYQNSLYSDNFAMMWIMDGTLKPNGKR